MLHNVKDMKLNQFSELITLLLIGCNGQNADLKQAHEIHLEAMKIAKELRTELKDMKSDSS